MIVTLTGFMGSGKTSVGKELAHLLDWDFIDLDTYIREKTGRSIPDLMAEGEEYFRATEAEAARDVIIMRRFTGGNLVFSLGGGTMTTGPIVPLILESTRCIHLEVSAETAAQRLSSQEGQRPLLPKDLAGIQTLLDARTPSYNKAEIHVDTENSSPVEIASKIRDLLF